jgi:hypothetical protein
MGHNRDLERFTSKFEKAENGCWIWIAGRKGGGYGTFYLNGKLHGAHRVSLFLFRDISLNTPLHAMHSCDNPSCVNPEHISYGTRSENMRDASKKGRIKSNNDWRGMLNPKAKLEERHYAGLVDRFNSGKTRKELALEFGVTTVRVGQILIKNGIRSPIGRSEAARIKRLSKKDCRKGHLLEGHNLRINSAGARICRQCESINAAIRTKNRDGGGWEVEEF